MIEQDEEGRYHLNSLHKAAGKLDHQQPGKFRANKGTQELIDAIQGESPNSETPPWYVACDGINNGTYVVKEIVYAYAMWIGAAFHLKVIRTFDAVVTGQIAAPIPDVLTQATLRTFDALLAREIGWALVPENDTPSI